jgi:hypothetical protein
MGGRIAEASTVIGEALPRVVRAANPTALTWAHYLVGQVEAPDHPERAGASFRTAMAWGDTVDSRLFATMATNAAAGLIVRTGPAGAAAEAVSDVLDRWIELGNTGAQGATLGQVVRLLLAAGRDARRSIHSLDRRVTALA